jgi:hypothetical protein
VNNFPMYLFGTVLYGKRCRVGRKFQCTEIRRKTSFTCTITRALLGSGLVDHKVHTNHSVLFTENYVTPSSSAMPCFY